MVNNTLLSESLNLDRVIDRQPLIVTPETPLVEVVNLMSVHTSSCSLEVQAASPDLSSIVINEVRASCVLVMDGKQLVGLITERDIVRFSAVGVNLEEIKAVDAIANPPVAIKQSQVRDIFCLVSIFHQHRIRHLAILNDVGEVAGLVTAYNIRQLLQPSDLLRWRTLAEVMKTNVVCADPRASVLTLAELMAEYRVSCVVIVENKIQRIAQKNLKAKASSSQLLIVNDQFPIGIVTEGDIVQFQALGLDFQTISAETVMSSPLFSLKPQDSLWAAHQQMEKLRVRRLVVCGTKGELQGIVTQTNLLQALDPVEMYSTIQSLQQEVCQLEAERVGILEIRNIELEKQVQERTAKLQQQMESDRLLAAIAHHIRRSLKIEEILNTTVTLIREFLQADRVLIYRFNPDWSGIVVAESVDFGWDTLLGKAIHDPCFFPDWIEPYTKGRIRAVNDIYAATDITPCHLELLKGWQIRAKLIVPIVQGDRLWGLMTAHHCWQPHEWQESEIELLDKLAIQVAIAIQQAELYQQAENEIAERQQIEKILRNIAMGVSAQTGAAFFRSLVQYLAETLGVEYAVVGELIPGSDRVVSIALWAEDRIVDNCEFDLADTPCYKVIRKQTCIYPSGVRQHFPRAVSLAQMKAESYVGTPLLDFNGRTLGLIAVVSRQPLRKPNLAEEVIKIFAVRAAAEIERLQGETARQKQLERERSIANIALKIRRSLDLENILDATVTEVQELLACDRVVVYQFATDMSGTVVAESVAPGWSATIGTQIEDSCFQNGGGAEYARGRKIAIANIYEAGLTDCHLKLLERFQVKANLVVPILLERDREQPTPYLWGLLIAHQCSEPRQWRPEQLDLLDELGVQLSIAIVQSQLYQQVRCELAERKRVEAALQKAKEELEVKVSDRTKELSETNKLLLAEVSERKQAELALKRENMKSKLFAEIALKIRKTLQIEEILQTTVTEVQKILSCDRVLIYRVFANGTGRTITESLTPGWSSVLDIPFPEEVFPREYQQQYTQGKVKAIADVEAEYRQMTPCLIEFLAKLYVKAKLVVPIVQQESLWGFIIAHQCARTRKWQEFEIDLLQQLATQVGIALSQAQFLFALRESEERYRRIVETASEGIWTIDADSYTTFVNDKMAQMLGFCCPQQMLEKPLWEFIDKAELENARKNVDRRRQGISEQHDFKFRRQDGRDLWALISTTPLLDEHQNYLGALAMVTDITERMKAEEKIQTSLKEKEVLLKEIHHRVKNNLYVIYNLLDLQSDTISNPRIQNLFADSQNRIQTMALIHEQLYQSNNLAQINFADYIHNLLDNLLSSFDTGFCQIQTLINVEPINFDIETAIPCGLLINELVTNSFKYAFNDHISGEIGIDMHQLKNCQEEKYQLKISDNGTGIPEDIDWQNSPSLGLRLVNILAEQLEATIELDRTNGTSFCLTFSQLKYQERF